VLASENCKKLSIGNPTDPEGEFAKSFKDPLVSKIVTSAFDTPNFTAFGLKDSDMNDNSWVKKVGGAKMPAPYLITPDWVARRRKRWGPASPMYQSRVLAQFPEQGRDTLIPLGWIEAAQQRTLEPGEPHELGVDVARYGDDKTVVYERRGGVIRLKAITEKSSIAETEGLVRRILREDGARTVKVDVIGLGAGVVDALIAEPELGVQASPVSVSDGASGSTADDLQFLNKKAELYWALRERFRDGEIDLDPEDEDLAADLSNMRYKINRKGLLVIEPKDEMKKRLGRSPDFADAVMLAFADEGVVGFDDEHTAVGQKLVAASGGTPWDDHNVGWD